MAAAFKIWQKIITINPSHLVAVKKINWLEIDVVRNCVESGDKLSKEGKLEEAFEYYKQALTLNPQQPMPIYRTCGNNLITLSKFEEAERIFKQLKEIYPELAESYEGYARIVHSLGNWELAKERWENAINKLPHYFNLYVQEGNVLITLFRYREV
ncbi:MAG: tetratricopeptide repeat protein [Okeania sp. SIO2F4]|uniref:tetratricopeptide repeat protein n=1 Tax=Okeania sp. SIO2F4 TaxID=2607790 RepID=UPI00142C7B76|nr:tetratricopeptide repeat protein [Okeania sp. SIO2F4]NES02710.1 tetratricopeptide repeat protein [Okeania sp. SIO2F4]